MTITAHATDYDHTAIGFQRDIPSSSPSAVCDRTDMQAPAPLRVVAVAAPDWFSGKKDDNALNSSDPASLYNACRVAAQRALYGNTGWSKSNWAGRGRAGVRANFQLLYSLDNLPEFKRLLEREKPNLLLLGAMSLCMPGAIECAKIAREMFGRDILIVLGGRHASETIYLWNSKARHPGDVLHHRGSPSRLIREGRIQPVFDAVVSGEGESLIAELGEIVAASRAPYDPGEIFRKLPRGTPGDWIVSLPSERTEIVSSGVPIDPNELPPLASLFGVSATFDIFNGRMTAHVFSDTGRGCVYDCDFCSERSRINGGLKDLENAAFRLYRQFSDAIAVIEEDHSGRGASAFVEDSVLLGGSPRALDQLAELLENDPLPIEFGAQFTVDQILKRETQLLRLSKVGLRYIFIGLETNEPNEIGGMSKDIGGKDGSWEARSERVFEILRRNGITCGCALLFGLGESHSSRLALLSRLISAKRETGIPTVLSANWAVQHPLQDHGGDAGYDYVEWGTPVGPYLELFHHFGEASLNYRMPGVEPPRIGELAEIVGKLRSFTKCEPHIVSEMVILNKENRLEINT
jgi:B12-binding domain/radical SAM domain protein